MSWNSSSSDRRTDRSMGRRGSQWQVDYHPLLIYHIGIAMVGGSVVRSLLEDQTFEILRERIMRLALANTCIFVSWPRNWE